MPFRMRSQAERFSCCQFFRNWLNKMRTLMLIAITSILASSAAVHAQSLAEQAQCAAQARKTFQEDSSKWDRENTPVQIRTISLDYQSHYNAKIGRCLILTTRTSTSILAGETSTSKFLDDAFERRNFAAYLWTSREGKKYWDVPPVACELNPSHGQTKYCKTQDEFDAFVAEYMEQ